MRKEGANFEFFIWIFLIIGVGLLLLSVRFEGPKEGDSLTLPYGIAIEVAEDIQNKAGHGFVAGRERCGTFEGGKLTILGVRDNYVIVIYSYPHPDPDGVEAYRQVECPDKAKLTLTKDEYKEILADMERLESKNRAVADVIKGR